MAEESENQRSVQSNTYLQPNVRELSCCLTVLRLFFVQESRERDDLGIDRLVPNRASVAALVCHNFFAS